MKEFKFRKNIYNHIIMHKIKIWRNILIFYQDLKKCINLLLKINKNILYNKLKNSKASNFSLLKR